MKHPTLPPEPSLSDWARGLALPFSAFGLMWRTPRLLGLALACAFVTALTLGFTALGAWQGGQWLAQKLISDADGWKHVAALGLGVVLFVMLFAAGALTLPNLLLAPLQDPLSEATESALGGFTAPPFSLGALLHGTFVALKHTLGRLVLMTAGSVLLLPLNFVPGVGNVLYVVLSSTWSMFWLAVEHLSNPTARHLRPFRQVLAVLRRRWALGLGFGAALFVMLWVPVLNFFLMPVAVVAGTLLYRALDAVNAFPPKPGNEDPSRTLGVP